jgi:hypothetical protein
VGGEFTTNVLTDRSGYYRFLLPIGKSYRVTPPASGPRINFTLYYPDPGFSIVPNLQGKSNSQFRLHADCAVDAAAISRD